MDPDPAFDPTDELIELLTLCHDDPDLFNSAVLARPAYWSSRESPEPGYPGQLEWCRALVEYHTVAIETGNMLGKDYWVGGLVPWWLWTRADSLVIVTGPGQSVLGSVTWKEVRRAIERCPFWPRWLPARVSTGVKTSPHVVEVAPGHQALGFSTTSVERASGQHAGELLVIVEEASGVEDEVWEAIAGLGARKLVVIGNPLRAEGGFARLCDQADADARDGVPPARAVRRLNVPSTASPHARLERSDVGLACATWLEQQYRRWGKDSLWVTTHIRAIRPRVSSEALLPEPWLDWCAAQPPRLVLPRDHPVHATTRIACDLGEGVGRDSSCVLARDDLGIREVVFGATLGLPEAAAAIARMAEKYDVPPGRISYDRSGIGRGFPVHLAKYKLQAALGYNGEGKPPSDDFTNLRGWAAFRLRCRLDPDHRPDWTDPRRGQPPFAIPCGEFWPRLREELKTLTYSLVGRKTKLLPKQDWCAVLGHSPDLADALIQSFSY